MEVPPRTIGHDTTRLTCPYSINDKIKEGRHYDLPKSHKTLEKSGHEVHSLNLGPERHRVSRLFRQTIFDHTEPRI